MKKHFSRALALVFVLCAYLECSPANPPRPGVFVAGNTYYPEGLYGRQAWLSLDGVSSKLYTPPCPSATALDVYILGGCIYACGYWLDNGSWIACYWVNGNRTDLTGSGEAAAFSIRAENGHVYIVGYSKSSLEAGAKNACIWKDGVRQNLPSGGVDAEAYSLVVQSGRTYIAGKHSTAWGETACVWIDGVLEDYDIALGVSSAARSIATQGGRIFVSGYSYAKGNRLACYWEDGVRIDLCGNEIESEALDISITETGTVNCSGYYSIDSVMRACVWLGGQRKALSDGSMNSKAFSIDWKDGSYYSAGTIYSLHGEGCLWVDGKKSRLALSEAYSVFLY